MLPLVVLGPVAPSSNAAIYPLQRLSFSRDLEPLLVLLAAVGTLPHVANANIIQLQMDQSLHPVHVGDCDSRVARRRRGCRRAVRVIPEQGEVMRALLRPLVNPTMHVVRPSNLQPNATRAVVGWIGRQGTVLLGCSDRIANAADFWYVRRGEQCRSNIYRRGCRSR